MVERTDQTALAIHREIACCPNGRRTHVTGKYGVLRSQLVECARDELRTKRSLTRVCCRQVVETFSGGDVVLLGFLQIIVVRLCLKERKQRTDGASHASDQGNIDVCSPADLFSAGIDLNYLRILWEKLRIGEVAAENNERVRMLHGCIAGGEAQQA